MVEDTLLSDAPAPFAAAFKWSPRLYLHTSSHGALTTSRGYSFHLNSSDSLQIFEFSHPIPPLDSSSLLSSGGMCLAASTPSYNPSSQHHRPSPLSCCLFLTPLLKSDPPRTGHSPVGMNDPAREEELDPSSVLGAKFSPCLLGPCCRVCRLPHTKDRYYPHCRLKPLFLLPICC